MSCTGFLLNVFLSCKVDYLGKCQLKLQPLLLLLLEELGEKEYTDDVNKF